MKYIRTKEGIYERMFPDEEHLISFDHKTIELAYYTTKNEWVAKKDIIKQADTIEDLCDKFVIFYNKSHHKVSVLKSIATARLYCKRDKRYSDNYVDKVYGAIWTDKGLIYVAKTNEKGELELL